MRHAACMYNVCSTHQAWVLTRFWLLHMPWGGWSFWRRPRLLNRCPSATCKMSFAVQHNVSGRSMTAKAKAAAALVHAQAHVAAAPANAKPPATLVAACLLDLLVPVVLLFSNCFCQQAVSRARLGPGHALFLLLRGQWLLLPTKQSLRHVGDRVAPSHRPHYHVCGCTGRVPCHCSARFCTSRPSPSPGARGSHMRDATITAMRRGQVLACWKPAYIHVHLCFPRSIPPPRTPPPPTWVTTPTQLRALRHACNTAAYLAIDVEHNDNVRYGGAVALIQVATPEAVYLLDPFVLSEGRIYECLNDAFFNPAVLKILHGAENDVLWLCRDFDLRLGACF